MSGLFTVAIAALAALFYLAAALLLKGWGQIPVWVTVSGVVLTLVIASLLEMEALRRARFAEVVLLIICTEVTLALALSRFLFHDGFSALELCGIAMMLAGIVLLLTGAAAPVHANDTKAMERRAG
ncbi:hypothetical protein D2N39_12150 [Gemmobacter lutimaris]|uniref:Uncharacterized protein n=1 Tax=Gemmobacter lutimaris TaxID=2306023 RepID=A0A398BRC1_9RHOB|nr:hypothetical protein [Gemmobacter lutimaris]RID91451.1 hypothetical protein D2N39_12150 [Gemmobacter lutimaris]